ncbi:MAG: hypothetical protein ACYDBQ_01155 [Thermoplasmatota archaeon]
MRCLACLVGVGALLMAGCSVPVPNHQPAGPPETVSSGPDPRPVLSGPIPFDFNLSVSAPSSVPVPGPSEQSNCVDVRPPTGIVLNVTATWNPQTPLAHTLTLRAFDRAGHTASLTSNSPARIHFVGNSTMSATVGIFVPNSSAAQSQAVHLHMDLYLVDAPGETRLNVDMTEHAC